MELTIELVMPEFDKALKIIPLDPSRVYVSTKQDRDVSVILPNN